MGPDLTLNTWGQFILTFLVVLITPTRMIIRDKPNERSWFVITLSASFVEVIIIWIHYARSVPVLETISHDLDSKDIITINHFASITPVVCWCFSKNEFWYHKKVLQSCESLKRVINGLDWCQYLHSMQNINLNWWYHSITNENN